MSDFRPPSFGWCPDLPDLRDFSIQSSAVSRLLAMLRDSDHASCLPNSVDLSEFFAPVTDQQGESSSCAHACLAMVEYFRRRVEGDRSRLSSRFTHLVTTQCLNRPKWSDVGLRSTWKTISRFGVLNDASYSQSDRRHDDDPDPFHYASCRRIDSLTYFRPITACQPGAEKLDVLQAFLAAGIPIVCGLSVPSSISRESLFDFRNSLPSISVLGGQAILLVGYSDAVVLESRTPPLSTQRVSAFRIRNSWGESWGDHGYGWLPYDYLLEKHGLIVDFWTALTPQWVESELFSVPNPGLTKIMKPPVGRKSRESSLMPDF